MKKFYIVFSIVAVVIFGFLMPCNQVYSQDRPNIVWITAEDHGPHLGAYGDSYAHTPTIDSFAERSFRYDVVWSDAPVCAPARTALITGVYPTSLGGQHMRSNIELPETIQTYPVLLRAAGYYVTNNSKEDYNVFGHETVWDESSPQAHYRNRSEGQPFFAVFNFTRSHESQVWNRTELPYHDPAEAPIPPYHPDTPEVRRDWAQYYHNLHETDNHVKDILNELEEDGLADETIVFFYSDHGSGLPRHKRWPYNSGLHVPLIVHVPEKYRHLPPTGYEPGGFTRRPVAFVDLAPTLLSMIGVEPPGWMQGRAFMGRFEKEPREYLYGFRGRMDERYDMVRTVRNDRFIYIRNYMPHKVYGQYLDYMWQMETVRLWEEKYKAGELEPPQTYFWEPKPAEELYDLKNDPHEIHNLVNDDQYSDILNEMREALRSHIMETRDAGFLPENEMHRRASTSGFSIYEMAQSKELYPLERIYEAANMAANRDMERLAQLLEYFEDPDPAVRYWAVLGILIRGKAAYEQAEVQLRRALSDDNPAVQIAAAEPVIQYGEDEDKNRAVDLLLTHILPAEGYVFNAIAAMNILSELGGDRLEDVQKRLGQMNFQEPEHWRDVENYVIRLKNSIIETHSDPKN